jgi:DNA-binding NarL/FixJ family response regulator
MMFDGSRYALVLGDRRLDGADILAPLHRHPLLDAVAVTPSPDELFGFVGRHGPPALAIIDLHEAAATVIEVAARLRRTWPATGLLAVGPEVEPHVRDALHASCVHVRGCPGKDADSMAAISVTLAGGAPLAGGGTDEPDDDAFGGRAVTAAGLGLSARQAEVLWFVLHGASNKRIAQRLALSEATVKEHVSAVLRRLSVGSRIEAIARLRGCRLVVPALHEPPSRASRAADAERR